MESSDACINSCWRGSLVLVTKKTIDYGSVGRGRRRCMCVHRCRCTCVRMCKRCVGGQAAVEAAEAGAVADAVSAARRQCPEGCQDVALKALGLSES